MSRPLYFCGDPHGDFSTLLALVDSPVGTVVIVGDLELPAPVSAVLAPLFAAGFDVRYIIGNHDFDAGAHQLLWLTGDKGGHPAGDIHGKVADLEGVRTAGLGGVFKGRVWSPKVGPPKYPSRADWMAANRQRWMGGLPLHMRDVIWQEDVEMLGKQRADVLVTHEGPSSVWKDMGFSVLDDLAEAVGARWLVHGHHHHSGVSVLSNGIRVKALGIGEIWRFPG
jgi:hypothetical protein